MELPELPSINCRPFSQKLGDKLSNKFYLGQH
jgi:hypothetical protein